jgi:hypothetical protein
LINHPEITMLPFIIALLLLVLIATAFAFATLTNRTGAADDGKSSKQFDFILNESLLTPAERSLYGALKACTGDQLNVFVKVRLADVFRPSKGASGSEWRSAQNKVDRKHVDFLLCRADDLAPVAGIELDDASHRRARRLMSLRTACSPLARFL